MSSDTISQPGPIGVIRSISSMLREHEHAQRVFSLTEEEDPAADGDTIVFRKVIREEEVAAEELAAASKFGFGWTSPTRTVCGFPIG